MYTRVQIASNWKELFTINCKHTYYVDGVCRTMTFEPTEETKRILKNYMLIFKPVTGGFKVIGNDPKSMELLKKQGNTKQLFFMMKVTDAAFINFTELPLDRPFEDMVYQYSKGQKDELVANRIQKIRQRLSYQTTEKWTAKSISILDPFGNKHQFKENTDGTLLESDTINLKIYFQKVMEKQYNYTIDFNYVEDGCYQLLMGSGKKKITHSFFKHNSGQRYFGMVQVDINELIDTKKEIKLAQNWTIQLTNRHTYWRYFLVQEEKVSYKNFKFFYKDIDLKIKLPKEQKQLMNGKKAYVFVSGEKKPLKERMTKDFRIEYDKVNLNIDDVNTKGSIGKGTRKLKLPAPKIKSIKPEKQPKSDLQKIYSDVYFYL